MGKKEPRAVTFDEFTEYQRRKGGGGGGGDEPPKSLKVVIREAFDEATLPMRTIAKKELREAMYADNARRLNELLPHFDRVVRGGIEGWLTARRIIRRGLPEPQ